MTRDPDARQLDLTEAITEVPQANNIALFIRLMETLNPQARSFDEIAEALEIDARTARYYADFGRWLSWIQPDGESTVSLTLEGIVFAESVPARGRLFASALFRRPLIQTINRLKREDFADLQEPQSTRAACLHAVERMTQLTEATAQRRASSLASMLRWAYHPRLLDWSTGQAQASTTAPFDFHGQSFLTAFASRQFGSSRTLYIGFPHQVVTFVAGNGTTLQPQHWVRASYELSDGSARWYGSIPINPSTLAVALRGGPDLRQLLISCNPFIALAITLLTPPAKAHPPPLRLTRDMYGLRFWHRERELGPPLPTLARLARAIDLAPINTIPHLAGRHTLDDLRPGTNEELVDTLLQSGFVQPHETSLTTGTNLPHYERLAPLRSALLPALRDLP